MSLYHVQYDSVSYWVEAANFTCAILAWKVHVKAAWGDDYDGTEEPESVHMVHEEAVIRNGVSCCTTAERLVLDTMYEDNPSLKADGIDHFDGYYCDFEEILAKFRNDPDTHSYSQSPLELITHLQNVRTELRERVVAGIEAARSGAQAADRAGYTGRILAALEGTK